MCAGTSFAGTITSEVEVEIVTDPEDVADEAAVEVVIDPEDVADEAAVL